MSILGSKLLSFYPICLCRNFTLSKLWYSVSNDGNSDGFKIRFQGKLSDSLYFKEEELNESFIKGWGPGGQKVNKTSNCIMLKHLPTGIVVKCQASRFQNINRQIARRVLQEKLDVYFNGPNSKLEIKKQKYLKEKKTEHEHSKRRLEMKKAFKEHLSNKKDSSEDKDDLG